MNQSDSPPVVSLTPAERDYAMLWLEQAEADAIEALHSRDGLHSLFWVQQSVEKSVKGLMLFRQKSYDDIRKVNHASLKGDLQIVGDLLEHPIVSVFIDSMVGHDSKKQLNELRSTLKSDKVYELREMSVGQVDFFLSITPNVRNIRKITLETQVDGIMSNVWRDKSPGEQMQALRELKAPNSDVDVSAFINSIITTYNLCEHYLATVTGIPEAEGSIRRILERLFEYTEATSQLYLLAAMTFPHVNSSRYPSRPDPSVTRPGDSFGIQHYSDGIGVFQRVRRLAKEARAVATALQSPPLIEQLPPCSKCREEEQP